MKKGRLTMSMKDIKTNKEKQEMTSELTGMNSKDALKNIELDKIAKLEKQNNIIAQYVQDMEVRQQEHEKQQTELLSKLKKATQEFRAKGVETHNDFVEILKDNLDTINAENIKKRIAKDVEDTARENKKMIEEVKKSHEHYQKRQKQLFTGIGAMLLVFMLFVLIMTIGSDFMNFLHVDVLQKAIASKLKASEGFMTFIWYIAYGLPYVLAIGLFIGLYEWIRARFHN
jgi:cation transport ATPase